MRNRIASIAGIACLANALLLADASYQSTSQVSGGSLMSILQSGPLARVTKDLSAPTNTLTMVHGNLKAVVTKDSTEIIDLDKETVTRIDTTKKTYSVITFAQIRQAVTAMQGRIAAAQGQRQQPPGQPAQPALKTSFESSVKSTGATKVINGLTAQEQVITLEMHVSDPSAPATAATYTVTSHVWIAPDPPAIKEVHDFDQRMAQKMTAGADLAALQAGAAASASASAAGMSALFGGHPGASEAMAQMGKEAAKLKGTRVLEITTMSGTGQGDAGAAATQSVTLMEQTHQLSNFSNEAIPMSVFEIPSGFTKVGERGRGGRY